MEVLYFDVSKAFLMALKPVTLESKNADYMPSGVLPEGTIP